MSVGVRPDELLVSINLHLDTRTYHGDIGGGMSVNHSLSSDNASGITDSAKVVSIKPSHTSRTDSHEWYDGDQDPFAVPIQAIRPLQIKALTCDDGAFVQYR